MRLENGNYFPIVSFPRRFECGFDLRWVMAVIVNNQNIVDGA